jgi:hypothetical protein
MQLTDVFPPIPKVKRVTTYRFDRSKETIDLDIWLRSLQGLVNRDEPHLYVVRTGANGKAGMQEDHWLDYYRATFDLPVEELADLDAFMERYAGYAQGYVLFDNEDVVQTQNVAITRCGLEGVLPVAPDQEHFMQRYGIKKVDDLRGKFHDNWDAAEWIIDNLWPHCYRKLHGSFCIHRPNGYAMGHELEDFIVRNKGVAVDLPASRLMRRPYMLYHKMMESADPPGVKMTWHCACEQEKEYVSAAAKHGFYVLCSSTTPNLSVHGGIGDPDKAYTQPLPDPETCKADPKKTYVCFYNSDGDATWAMNNLHSDNWIEPGRGKFKFGWGFLPLMVRLMPGQLQYYHETKTPNDCFWGPSSGAAYTYSWAWPDDLVGMYLGESRELLNQSGQNGCNMVNWFLQDWWREVENEDTVNREKELLGGPGLVCGLGGSPWAKNYPHGRLPKLHSVHIANAGRDNHGDIVKLAEECPTRPLFMFLFAQIARGVFKTLEDEMVKFEADPDIEVLSMDEFFLTLQDAEKRGMIGDELYEKTPEMEETWLKSPGRHRLPLCERLCEELATIARAEPAVRAQAIGDQTWTDLVSMEIESAAGDRDLFLTRYKGRRVITSDDQHADALLYVGLTVAWTLVRAAIDAQGIYSNHRDQCLADFRRLCGDMVDMTPFDGLFGAWAKWDDGPPELEAVAGWCEGVWEASKILVDRLGPDESEEEFTSWPPRSI